MTGQILVDGLWLATLGGWGDLTYSHVANGGCEQASWSMGLGPSFVHPSLSAGKLVQVREGSANVWSGILAEPDRSVDGWSLSAAGLASDLGLRLALDGSGNTTSKPDTAIDTAIANGLPVTRPASLSSSSYASSDDTVAVNKTGDLLDSWALSVSKRWGVNADREVYAATDPTTPTWYLTAGAGKVGLADDEYASDLYGRYRSGAATYATVHVSDALASAQYRREEPVDLTHLGIITGTQATNVLNGMLANGKARYAWTQALTPSRVQITTPGGQPAYLPFVKAGDLARLFGVLNEQGDPLPYLDFVIGRTEYQDGADTISISPVNLAARNLQDVLSLAVGA